MSVAARGCTRFSRRNKKLKHLTVKKKISLIAKAALDKKAKDVILLDLRKLPSLCDYFLIAGGDSTTQIASIAENIEQKLLMHNCRPWHKEGTASALWLLLDYGDIVVHIFYKDTRSYYNLEKLWYDAPQKKLEPESNGKKKVKKRTRRKASATP